MEANHLSNDWFKYKQRTFDINKSLCLCFVFFFLTSIRGLSLTMNSRVTNIILPIIAVIVFVCIDLLYVFLARNGYTKAVENIQKEKMQIDIVAAIICYAS